MGALREELTVCCFAESTVAAYISWSAEDKVVAGEEPIETERDSRYTANGDGIFAIQSALQFTLRSKNISLIYNML